MSDSQRDHQRATLPTNSQDVPIARAVSDIVVLDYAIPASQERRSQGDIFVMLDGGADPSMIARTLKSSTAAGRLIEHWLDYRFSKVPPAARCIFCDGGASESIGFEWKFRVPAHQELAVDLGATRCGPIFTHHACCTKCKTAQARRWKKMSRMRIFDADLRWRLWRGFSAAAIAVVIGLIIDVVIAQLFARVRRSDLMLIAIVVLFTTSASTWPREVSEIQMRARLPSWLSLRRVIFSNMPEGDGHG